MLVVVVGHLVLAGGGLVGLVLLLLAGLEVVEQGLEAVTKEEAGSQGSVCLGQDLSLSLILDGGGAEDILSIYWEVTRIMCTWIGCEDLNLSNGDEGRERLEAGTANLLQ